MFFSQKLKKKWRIIRLIIKAVQLHWMQHVDFTCSEYRKQYNLLKLHRCDKVQIRHHFQPTFLQLLILRPVSTVFQWLLKQYCLCLDYIFQWLTRLTCFLTNRITTCGDYKHTETTKQTFSITLIINALTNN